MRGANDEMLDREAGSVASFQRGVFGLDEIRQVFLDKNQIALLLDSVDRPAAGLTE